MFIETEHDPDTPEGMARAGGPFKIGKPESHTYNKSF